METDKLFNTYICYDSVEFFGQILRTSLVTYNPKITFLKTRIKIKGKDINLTLFRKSCINFMVTAK